MGRDPDLDSAAKVDGSLFLNFRDTRTGRVCLARSGGLVSDGRLRNCDLSFFRRVYEMTPVQVKVGFFADFAMIVAADGSALIIMFEDSIR